jgi:glycosyltransferase involved in cell wall biosynthesis
MISIVLPCYNPVEGWCKALAANIEELNRKLPEYIIQYIVSNDGSTILLPQEVADLKAIPNMIFLDNPVNEGKGSAIRKGTGKADGEIIIYTDIDFPFGTDSVVDILRIFISNPDCWFVYGNRNSDYFKKLPVKRQLISKGLHLINLLFLSKHITDTQAGIKGLRRELLPDVQETKTNTFVFEIELIRKLIRKKINIGKIEVNANPSIVFSDFGYKTIYREVVNLARIIILSGIWNDIS